MMRSLKDRGVAATAFLILLVDISSCQKVIPSSPPGGNLVDPTPGARASTQSWKLSYSPGTEMTFSLDSDGSYAVETTLDDQAFRGELSREDLASLDDLDTLCSEAAKDHSIAALTRGGHETYCSDRLTSKLRALSDKYIPRPFPNPCTGASEALAKLHDEVKRCSHDQDCSWIAPGYLPIDEQELKKGRTPESDDCGWIRPLVVANAFETVASQRNLVLARAAAEDICRGSSTGGAGGRPGCWRKADEITTIGLPACVHGSCQIIQGGFHQ